MNLLFGRALDAADQERLDVDAERPVARVPASVLEVKVLARLEPEQRQRGERVALGAKPEQDDIFALHLPELGGYDERRHHRVAELGPAGRSDAQIAVRFGGEDGVAGHCATAAAGRDWAWSASR